MIKRRASSPKINTEKKFTNIEAELRALRAEVAELRNQRQSTQAAIAKEDDDIDMQHPDQEQQQQQQQQQQQEQELEQEQEQEKQQQHQEQDDGNEHKE